VIYDPSQKVTASTLLDAIEEFRDAGAEVIEINDSIRVVASTWFGGANGALVADNAAISLPLVIDVIGEGHALEEAARFRAGSSARCSSSAHGDDHAGVDGVDHGRTGAASEPVCAPRVTRRIRMRENASGSTSQESQNDFSRGLKYSTEHEWVRQGNARPYVSGSRTMQPTPRRHRVRVLADPGQEVAAGDACGELESTSRSPRSSALSTASSAP